MNGLFKIDACHASTLGGGGGIGDAAFVLDTCDIAEDVLATCDIGGDTMATYGSCVATSVGAPEGEPGGGDIAGGNAALGLASGRDNVELGG